MKYWGDLEPNIGTQNSHLPTMQERKNRRYFRGVGGAVQHKTNKKAQCCCRGSTLKKKVVFCVPCFVVEGGKKFNSKVHWNRPKEYQHLISPKLLLLSQFPSSHEHRFVPNMCCYYFFYVGILLTSWVSVLQLYFASQLSLLFGRFKRSRRDTLPPLQHDHLEEPRIHPMYTTTKKTYSY